MQIFYDPKIYCTIVPRFSKFQSFLASEAPFLTCWVILFSVSYFGFIQIELMQIFYHPKMVFTNTIMHQDSKFNSF